MARIQVTGDSPLAAQVEYWLRRWGHTVTRCVTATEFRAAASIRRSDVIVIACDGRGLDGYCPLSLPLFGEVPPLLQIGRSDQSCRRQMLYCERVPEPGRAGRQLARGLRRCLARAVQMKAHADELKGHQEYVQFLSHEIRTPITSALSALEILSRDAMTESGQAVRTPSDRRDGFVQLALRNLKRLRETVEWTEEYLAARTLSLVPRWEERQVGELFTQASGQEGPRPDLSLVFEAGSDAGAMVSDPQLLRTLVQQVLRTLRYHAPGARVTLRLSRRQERTPHHADPVAHSEDAEVVVAAWVSTPSGTDEPGSVSRAGLTRPGDPPEAALLQLLEYSVSPELLALLGGRITIPAPSGARVPALVLALPVVPPGAVPGLPCVMAPAQADPR